MIRPSIRQLSYLIAIEDHGSFVQAAEHCGVTQSTLSAGIKELENILSQSVVVRGRKKATLTPFGTEVADQARGILIDTDRIVSRARILKEPMSGPVRIGIIPTIAPYLLPEILPKLTEKFPRLEPQLHEDLTDNIVEALQKSKLDVGILAFPFETPGLSQTILYEEPFYLATGQNAGIDQPYISIADLDPHKLLLLEDGHCLRDHAITACQIEYARARATFSATSLPTLIQMVRAGFGMTLLPEMACTKEVLPSGIQLMKFNDERPPTRMIGLCWRENDVRKKDYAMLAQTMSAVE